MRRRHFLATAAATTAFAPVSSYARILGANDRLGVGVVGLNGRGRALVAAVLANGEAFELRALCDVDSTTYGRLAGGLGESAAAVTDLPTFTDYRRLLESPDIDVVAIATPEHWHTPMAILALKAGKHVYLEKPCSFCPAEGELLVEAQEKYGKLIQMGNQQRSAPSTREAIAMIHDGAIGRPYIGKAWYANQRGPIGEERLAPVPEHLDWELWQGPAPREAYAEPWVHYDWHWHRKWGTGEINNNGTHEIDVCRWALDVDYPERVASSGGRFHYDDAWQWYDTQTADYTYADGKAITWEGRSCNPAKTYDRGRGAWIGGTEGWALLDRGGATLYDLSGEQTWQRMEEATGATLNTVGAGPLDTFHWANLAAGVTRGEDLHSPIADARISQWHCHLGNIALDLGQSIDTDPTTGKAVDNPAAAAKWNREYEPGWEPSV